MKTVFRTMILLAVILGFFSQSIAAQQGAAAPARPQAVDRWSILFGWKTDGSHELLARQASAFRSLKGGRSLAIGFGGLLGSTLIVRHDTADQFLTAAREAGFDYIIPGAAELMFGIDTARRFASNDRYPRFMSANIVEAKTKSPVFEPYATWYVSGLRICIIALSDTAFAPGARGPAAGFELLSYDEALNAVAVPVALERADVVILAGRLDRNAVTDIALRHPFVDIFLTNRQAGGFTDERGTASSAVVSGKPVYIGPEEGNRLGMLAVRALDGIETREFTAITLGDAWPPEKNLFAALTRTLDEFKRRDAEETAVAKTGAAASSTLREMLRVDAVLLHRQSLYYYPLRDSLTMFNVRNIVRPFEKISRFQMKGKALLDILADMKTRNNPDDRLILAGLRADGKIDSFPVSPDSVYTVVATTHLRSGGNGYIQFREGRNETLTDINMLAAMEDFLVEKDERLRRLARKKPWNLTLNLSIVGNINKIDIDRDKKLYKSIPAPFGSLTEQFLAFFGAASRPNTFSYISGRHSYLTTLEMDYRRLGSRTPSGEIVYGTGADVFRFANRYEYRIPTFPSVPYVDMIATSAIHPNPAAGHHPLRVDMSSGLSRKFPEYWSEVSVGLNGSRDYVTLRNNLGSKTEIKVNKTFPAHSLITAPSQLSSATRIWWAPSAQSRSMFRHENENSFAVQIIKKVSVKFQVNSYSYRDNTKKKVAAGFQYYMDLVYGMQWKL